MFILLEISKVIPKLPYYTNIKCSINQREFGSHNANLSHANKCGMQIFVALIYTHMKKMKLNLV